MDENNNIHNLDKETLSDKAYKILVELRKHSGGLLFGSREAISSVQSVIDTIHWGFISAYSEK